MAAMVSGTCAPGLEEVASAFEENFVSRGEVGAAVCIMHNGVVVVDLVGGLADVGLERPWKPDTLVDVYSVGKAFIALAALRQVDAGKIGLDDPITTVWPEYAAQGKAATTLRQALSHVAGVPAIHEPLTDEDLLDWDRMVDALAATAPWSPPGTRLTYHTNTYGHLIGEVVRRCTGALPGVEIEAIAQAAGADIHVGLTDADQERCATVEFQAPIDPRTVDLSTLEGDARLVASSYFNPPGYSSIGLANSTGWRAAQIPSTNAHASARGVAAVYQGLLRPSCVLSQPLLDEAVRPQSSGWCPVLGEDAVFGLGFKPTSPRRPFGTSARAFGHFGTGGAVGFADPEHSVAFGYVMNHVIPRWQSTRNRALIDAFYRAL